MTEKIPEISEQEAQRAVDTTKHLIVSMIERIFDTQRKLGVWESDDDAPETENFSDFMLHVHAKLSSAYQSYVSGGVLDQNNQVIDLATILIDIAIELLGAARRFNQQAGSKLINMIIQQAREAIEIERQASGIGDLGEYQPILDENQPVKEDETAPT